MNENTPGAAPWNQPGAFNPSPEVKPTREPRQKRNARAEAPPKARKERTAPVAETPAAVPPKKPRKAKKAKVEKTPTLTIKLGIKEYAVMRLGEESKLFLKLHNLLSPVSKGARAKVLTELTKVLG